MKPKPPCHEAHCGRNYFGAALWVALGGIKSAAPRGDDSGRGGIRSTTSLGEAESAQSQSLGGLAVGPLAEESGRGGIRAGVDVGLAVAQVGPKVPHDAAVVRLWAKGASALSGVWIWRRQATETARQGLGLPEEGTAAWWKRPPHGGNDHWPGETTIGPDATWR